MIVSKIISQNLTAEIVIRGISHDVAISEIDGLVKYNPVQNVGGWSRIWFGLFKPAVGTFNVLYVDKTLKNLFVWNGIDYDLYGGGGSSDETDPIFNAWLLTNPLAGFLTSESDPIFTAWLLTNPITPQIQSDWNQTNNVALDYIKNKPTIPSPTITYIRRSDYILLDRKSYIGIAPYGSLETDAVWTIWITVTNTAGEVVSNTQYINKKWSERNLL